jgi:hypothetical protein
MADVKAKRDRSPAFPMVPLGEAVERLTAFEKYNGRHAAPLDKAGLAWGLKQVGDILASLRYYGFIEYTGSAATRQVAVTEEGRNLIRAQQDSVKQQILQRAALRPKEMAKFWPIWGADRPPDPVCIDQLVMHNGFSDRGAPLFLRSYDATIAYAGLAKSDKVPNDQTLGGVRGEPPPATVKIGDLVQWNSGGSDQFPIPRKVVWLSDDGAHLRVHGSMTGIPVAEITVVEPPKSPSVSTQPKSASSAYAGGDGELSVLLRGNRLEITADVDRAGLQRLKEILGKYEEILKLIDPPPQSESA